MAYRCSISTKTACLSTLPMRSLRWLRRTVRTRSTTGTDCSPWALRISLLGGLARLLTRMTTSGRAAAVVAAGTMAVAVAGVVVAIVAVAAAVAVAVAVAVAALRAVPLTSRTGPPPAPPKHSSTTTPPECSKCCILPPASSCPPSAPSHPSPSCRATTAATLRTPSLSRRGPSSTHSHPLNRCPSERRAFQSVAAPWLPTSPTPFASKKPSSTRSPRNSAEPAPPTRGRGTARSPPRPAAAAVGVSAARRFLPWSCRSALRGRSLARTCGTAGCWGKRRGRWADWSCSASRPQRRPIPRAALPRP